MRQDVFPVTQEYPLSNTIAGARYCSNWTIVDDDELEEQESFRVSLFVTDPFILLGELATVTILDNDCKKRMLYSSECMAVVYTRYTNFTFEELRTRLIWVSHETLFCTPLN